jgi:membrane fusion protein (multidrug efflux system)
MDPYNPQSPKPPFKFTGERIALMLGGTFIGALAIVFSFKLANPIVKKVCQSILEAPDKGERDMRVASVEAIVLKPGTISRRITTIGQLRANESVTIHTEMQGRIKEIAFKEGSMVKKGDVLIRFEDEELQAELAKAEADVEYRQVKFDRMTNPQFKGFTRGHDFDQERGNLNVAKAAVELAKAKLAKATITAPFDGKIGLINVSAGAFVDTQKELVTIVDFDPMKIDFKIPEKFIHDIGVGQTAVVKLDSFPEHPFQATVEAIDSRVDPQTHSIAVRASIPNEDGKLQTGLFGSVGVIIGVKNDALLVPESALGREGDIEYVWVVVNGKSARKRVLTGTKENGQVEITAGLRVDEIVVTSGQLKLGEGTAVKISNMPGGDVEVTDEGEESTKPQAAASPSKKDVSPPSNEASPKVSGSSDQGHKDVIKPAHLKDEGAPAVAGMPDVKDPPTKDEVKPSESLPQNPAASTPLPPTPGVEAKPEALPNESSSAKPVEPLKTEKEADKAPLSDSKPVETTPKAEIAPSPESLSKDSVSPQLDSVKPPSVSDKGDIETGNAILKVKEESDEDSPELDSEDSFFTKARNYVVNLFKRS